MPLKKPGSKNKPVLMAKKETASPNWPKPTGKILRGDLHLKVKQLQKVFPDIEFKVVGPIIVADVPLDLIDFHDKNPNEQDEATFNELVEGMKRDGFNDPLDLGVKSDEGRFECVGGEHRIKGAQLLTMKSVPAVIFPDWGEDKRKIELVRRNMLRGRLNPKKFTDLYNELTDKYDKELLKTMMGFTKEDGFRAVYQEVSKNLSKAQKKKLDEAKESIRSVDDLSSVLNRIFTDHGSDLEHGFLVFTFGNKDHHYIPTDKELDKMLKKLEETVRTRSLNITDIVKQALAGIDYGRLDNLPSAAPANAGRKKVGLVKPKPRKKS